jgi:dihydroorotate dehydrogenase (NAD+) catalytic subunit
MVRMMLAGGSAVEMASAVMLRGTSVLESALVEFDNYLREKNVTATEIIGMAADRRKTFPEMPLRANNWKKYVADVK